MTKIKTIDICGNCIHHSTCEHFCVITYVDTTYHTIKCTGLEIVINYWVYLSDKDKKKFQHLYNMCSHKVLQNPYVNHFDITSFLYGKHF
jgi:hypothetical protein